MLKPFKRVSIQNKPKLFKRKPELRLHSPH